jgi:hypothetical protein
MKIKLDGEWVCSICGDLWGSGATCESCGAASNMEDLPLDGDCIDLADPADLEDGII